MITIMMVPLAVVIISYALFTFYMRSKFMERKQVSHPGPLLWLSHHCGELRGLLLRCLYA